jgi:hypothetical protein
MQKKIFLCGAADGFQVNTIAAFENVTDAMASWEADKAHTYSFHERHELGYKCLMVAADGVDCGYIIETTLYDRPAKL